MRTVSEVSELTGVTVRALHHYDEIEVLVPNARSESGYRLYSHADLERLQEILGWRALGLPLAEIAALLGDPRQDREPRLRRQRELVEQELGRLGAVARGLDAAISALEQQTKLEEETMFEGFEPAEYEAEARERWGDCDAYRESSRRTAGYRERDWSSIHTEAEAIMSDFAALLSAAAPATGGSARAVAERHRQHISRWFYPCSPQMHRGLGEMYVSDQRFARTYERRVDGLAVFLRDAIAANAQALGGG